MRDFFPVPLDVCDETISVLRHAVGRARLGNDDRLAAIARLDRQARQLERWVEGPDLDTFVAEERKRSASFGGRTVIRDRLVPQPVKTAREGASKGVRSRRQRQLELPL